MMAESIQELDDREEVRLERKSLSKSTSVKYLKLNRYTNILCYDDSLPTTVEYINASVIEFKEFNCNTTNAKRFIATQAPPVRTFGTFYSLILEEGVRDIVQVSNYQENGRPKVDYYLPDDKELQFGDITVKTLSVEDDAECLTTHLEISTNSKAIQTRHILYKNWPDHSAPTSLRSLIGLLGRLDESAPCVVHCSAGVGRSATLIALHEMLRCKNQPLLPFYDDLKGRSYENSDIVYRTVDFIRRQRPLSCEAKQIAWLNQAVNRL